MLLMLGKRRYRTAIQRSGVKIFLSGFRIVASFPLRLSSFQHAYALVHIREANGQR